MLLLGEFPPHMYIVLLIISFVICQVKKIFAARKRHVISFFLIVCVCVCLKVQAHPKTLDKHKKSFKFKTLELIFNLYVQHNL